MGEAEAESGGRILLASNRGPVSFTQSDDGRLTAKRGGGGMVSGLLTVADKAEVLWVCAALSDADRAAARAAPDGLLNFDHGSGSRVQMLNLPAETFHRAYNAVANSTLWFVHHMLYDTPRQPSFGLGFLRDWQAFRDYNEAFAVALADAATGTGASPGPSGARAVIQDYHLCLAPRMLASRAPGTAIAHFSHTPWAPPDYYRLLPDAVGREVLAGILGADHAGFLSQRWAAAFEDCCEAFLGAKVDRDAGLVSYDGHVTSIGVHPLGVDAEQLRHRASQDDVLARMKSLTAATGGRKLIVRIDRTELSKNIVRGLQAYRELLRTRPEWHREVVHLAFSYPSRSDLPEYRQYTAAVQQLAEEISAEFAAPDWDPLIVAVDDDYPRSLAACRIADILLVNPIRDGMNLVAKEGPVLSDGGCALVLSTEAGAAAELGEHALLVNPFDVAQTAQALHAALSMTAQERQQRSAALSAAAAARTPATWFAEQLTALNTRAVSS